MPFRASRPILCELVGYSSLSKCSEPRHSDNSTILATRGITADRRAQHASLVTSLHRRIHHKPRRRTNATLPTPLQPIQTLPSLLPNLQRHLPSRRLRLPILNSLLPDPQPLLPLPAPTSEPFTPHTSRALRLPTKRIRRLHHHILGRHPGWFGVREYVCGDNGQCAKGA